MATLTLSPAQTADDIHALAMLTYVGIYDLIKEQFERLILGLPEQWAFDIFALLSGLDDIITRWEPLIGRTLADTTIATYLAGADEVARDVGLPYLQSRGWTPPILPPPNIPLVGLAMSGDPEPVIEFPIIEAAARRLAHKRLMERWQFDALASEARANAFTVAGVNRMKTLEGIRRSLVKSVGEGQTFGEWQKTVPNFVEWSPLSPRHQETVWRTNIQTSLSQGKDAVLDHPFVAQLFPYEAIIVIDDERLCPICSAAEKAGLLDIHGNRTNIFRRDDPVWRDLLKPPLHWSCRCGRQHMDPGMAAERGIPEAIEWERTGRPPETPAWVPMPDVVLPAGWRRAA